RRLPLSLLSRWTRCPRWPARAERGGEWPDGRGRAFGLRPFTAGPATVGGATGGIEAQAFARATAVLAVPVALAVTAPTARAAGSPAAPGRCCPGRGHRCQLGRFDRRLRLGESAGRAAGGAARRTAGGRGRRALACDCGRGRRFRQRSGGHAGLAC